MVGGAALSARTRTEGDGKRKAKDKNPWTREKNQWEGRRAKKRLPVRLLLPRCLGLEVASGSHFCAWAFPAHALALAALLHSIFPLPQPPAGPQPPLQDDHQE